MLPLTIAEAARRFAHRTAYVAPRGWELSYRDVDRISEEAAVGLARHGRAGDVVALAAPGRVRAAYYLRGEARAITAASTTGSRRAKARRCSTSCRVVIDAGEFPPPTGRSGAGRSPRPRRSSGPAARRRRPAGRDHLHVRHHRTAQGTLYCNRQLRSSHAPMSATPRAAAFVQRHLVRTPRVHDRLPERLRRGDELHHGALAGRRSEMLARERMTTIAGCPRSSR